MRVIRRRDYDRKRAAVDGDDGGPFIGVSWSGEALLNRRSVEVGLERSASGVVAQAPNGLFLDLADTLSS